ncbi:MAG: ribbon-helix-helix protein, CopG family [Acidobacteria bacterium]|nr:ribbon-helix-helix protein, CopG family [Acidobacteriota bacterium]
MSVAKVTISIEQDLLTGVDRLVSNHQFASRSQAIQAAVEEKLNRITHTRLAEECLNLDRFDEQSLAEEGLDREIAEWPEY